MHVCLKFCWLFKLVSLCRYHNVKESHNLKAQNNLSSLEVCWTVWLTCPVSYFLLSKQMSDPLSSPLCLSSGQTPPAVRLPRGRSLARRPIRSAWCVRTRLRAATTACSPAAAARSSSKGLWKVSARQQTPPKAPTPPTHCWVFLIGCHIRHKLFSFVAALKLNCRHAWIQISLSGQHNYLCAGRNDCIRMTT